MLYTRGDLPGAVILYKKVLSIDPQHAGAHYALGLVLARQGDMSGAKAEFDHAARLDMANPLPRLAVARWHASRNDFNSALDAVDQALKRQPGLLDAQMLRAEVLESLGKPDQALADYKKVIQQTPNAWPAHLRLGMLAQRTGQHELALTSYKKVIELEPKQAIAYNNLAMLSIERKLDLAQAQAWADTAVALQPSTPDYLDTLASVQQARGQLPAAVATLHKALGLAPERADILFHLAQLQAQLGEKAMAIEALRKALGKGTFAQTAEAKKLLAQLER